MVEPGGEGVGGRRAIKSEANRCLWGVAVVKVTPSVGCVKYKAQHIVLPVRIPVLMGGKWPGGAKNGGFCCGFSRKGAKLVGLLFSNRASFEGRRDGAKGQGAGVVQVDVDGGGNVGKGGTKRTGVNGYI